MAAFSVLAMLVASGCGASADGASESPTTQAFTSRTCPEAVTTDSHGDLRNAAGHVRECWPGDEHCECDSDDDCYALQGHVACTPAAPSEEVADAGVTAARAPAQDGGATVARPADAGARTTTPTPADAGVRTTTPTPADAGVRTPTPADAGARTATPTPADAGVRAPTPTPADAGVRTPTPTPADAGARTTTPTPADAGVRTPTPTPAPTPAPSGPVPTVGGCQVFPADNAWNQVVTSMPVHPNSDAIIANIQAHGQTTIKADFGSNTQYGIPFVVVPAGQARVPIHYTAYGDESDPGPFPIPTSAPIEGGNDHHVLVVQQGSCMLYELYHSVRAGSGWNADSGAMFDLNSNALRPRGWTSADQGGLPILAGLTRFDEVAAGEINHALRVTFDHTQNGFILPAHHVGGVSDANAPPMGLRLRLRADFDISRYTGQARVILNALRRYGLIVADTGSNWFISGATDSRWNDSDLRQLTNVSGTAFEVVYTGDIQR